MSADSSVIVEKHHGGNVSAIHQETRRSAAEPGQMATDRYGQPLVQFDTRAEARLRWKLDLHLLPTVALLYLFCFIDRANIGNARLAGFERDLGMSGYDYNILLSVFYVSYVLFEIPSNAMCKWIGPGWFIPAISFGFGICSIFTAIVRTMPQACGVRFLLGLFEAGMFPGIAYYLSRWYRRAELAFRLAMYLVMAPLAGAFGGLLASAILQLNQFGSLKGWQMIFAIEGVITTGLAIIAFFTLTDRPSTARWLTKEEKELCIARVKSERVGTTSVLDSMDKVKLLRGIINPVTISISFIFLLVNITVQGLAFFTPTIVRTIYPRASVVRQQLYTVPPYLVGAFFCLAFSLLSWKMDRRQIIISMSAPLGIAGYTMFLASTDPKVRYGATFLVTSSVFALGPLTSAQVSANVISDTARSSAIGTTIMLGNIGGLVSTWSFLPFDAPNYHIGNGLNLATSAVVLICSTLLIFWMKWDNDKRDGRNVEEELAGMSQKEIEDLDWKHPAFRWRQ